MAEGGRRRGRGWRGAGMRQVGDGEGRRCTCGRNEGCASEASGGGGMGEVARWGIVGEAGRLGVLFLMC